MYASICRLRLALSRHLRRWTYALVGREISRITRYADRVVHVDPLPSDTGMLLDAIDAPRKETAESRSLAAITARPGCASMSILFNGNFNHSTDIQGLLETFSRIWGGGDAWSSRSTTRTSRGCSGWPIDSACDRDRRSSRSSPRQTSSSWPGLAGFELVRLRPVAYVPWHFFGLGSLLNVVMPAVPGLRWLSLVTVAVLRPVARLLIANGHR